MPEIIKIKPVFDLGTEVYLKTDINQYKGIIVAVEKEWNGGVRYRVKFCDDSVYYQAIELSPEKGATVTIPKPEEDEDE